MYKKELPIMPIGMKDYNQSAFANRMGQVLVCKFDKKSRIVKCSNGVILDKSANFYRARTERGEKNLKVAKLSKSNWKVAAAWYADKIGFCKRVDVVLAESIDFDQVTPPVDYDPDKDEALQMRLVIREWAKTSF